MNDFDTAAQVGSRQIPAAIERQGTDALHIIDALGQIDGCGDGHLAAVGVVIVVPVSDIECAHVVEHVVDAVLHDVIGEGNDAAEDIPGADSLIPVIIGVGHHQLGVCLDVSLKYILIVPCGAGPSQAGDGLEVVGTLEGFIPDGFQRMGQGDGFQRVAP